MFAGPSQNHARKPDPDLGRDCLINMKGVRGHERNTGTIKNLMGYDAIPLCHVCPPLSPNFIYLHTHAHACKYICTYIITYILNITANIKHSVGTAYTHIQQYLHTHMCMYMYIHIIYTYVYAHIHVGNNSYAFSNS